MLEPPRFLIFQLYGGMSSWGGVAVGDVRPCEGRPGNSAVLGMVAAALGIERCENEKHLSLQRALGIGVCVRKRGEFFCDYHTVQVPDGKRRGYRNRREELGQAKINTVVSTREYRSDFFYQIALWKNDSQTEYTLDKIKDALKRPSFVLSLGRKSCPPGLPLNPVIISQESSLLSAFTRAFKQDSFSRNMFFKDSAENFQSGSYYWEKDSIAEENVGIPKRYMLQNTRRNKFRNRRSWQFSNLEECYVESYKGE